MSYDDILSNNLKVDGGLASGNSLGVGVDVDYSGIMGSGDSYVFRPSTDSNASIIGGVSEHGMILEDGAEGSDESDGGDGDGGDGSDGGDGGDGGSDGGDGCEGGDGCDGGDTEDDLLKW